METLRFVLSGPVPRALGWTLLHAFWQGFALVLPVAVLLHYLRNRPSQWRYTLGIGTLLAQVLVSVITFWLCYDPPLAASGASVARFSVSPAELIQVQGLTRQLPWSVLIQSWLSANLPQIVTVWLLGAGLCWLRLVGGWLYLQRLRQTAIAPADPRWATLLVRVQTKLGLRTTVQLRESARVAGPMVVGVLRPVVLLPLGLLAGLSMAEAEAVLAHELAHIRRHDYGVNLLQSLIGIVYFFHPALWWLSARVREERENCCDDLAVSVTGDGRTLARALAKLQEQQLQTADWQMVPAMALIPRRQQLLHRVRRMLGVAGQPAVSNGQLLTLTLATLLLIGGAGYAVKAQQQPKPKPGTTKPQTTRRHTVEKGTEYGMADNKTITYVIWKGQKLPASRVARLQQQLNQVLTGQRSLDDVAQPDRDVLLTIFETNQVFDNGMNGLANGLAQIDYNNIIANAMNGVAEQNESTRAEVYQTDYNKLVGDAMASLSMQSGQRSDSLDRQMAIHNRQIDSLSRLVAEQQTQIEAMRLQMEAARFQTEELDRKMEVLDWKKNKASDQRNALLDKQRQLLNPDDSKKAKPTDAEVEKQLDALEQDIKKQEQQILDLNKSLETLRGQLKTVRQPLDAMERKSNQLEEQVSNLSEQISGHGDAISRLADHDMAGDAYNVDTEFSARPARPVRMKKPRPPKPPRPVVNVNTNVAPAAPALKATPRPAPTPKPAPRPVVRP
jgi:bla regulator protein blaR1